MISTLSIFRALAAGRRRPTIPLSERDARTPLSERNARPGRWIAALSRAVAVPCNHLTVDPVADAFAAVLGRPSWLVRKGHGSFVTFKFGEPELEIREPHLGSVYIDGAPPKALQRSTQVHGQWHLWVYSCDWSLSLGEARIAHSESDAITLARALHVLNGQARTAVSVDPSNGATRFVFDLGCTLTTTPATTGTYSGEPVEQWFLYEPSGHVLTVRGDGMYQRELGASRNESGRWLPLPTG